jgi:hypothetical protein
MQPKIAAKSPINDVHLQLEGEFMKIKTFWLAGLTALFLAFSAFAETKTREQLAQLAVSTDASVSTEAVKNLRAFGRDGLDALFQTYGGEIAKFSRTGEAGEDWKRIAAALDAVAMQKDAYASNLFWYTDFEEAKREAARTKKPILSLRLLGNLNEEFSCANSRFFRALLYANADVSKYLRDNYVLHWKSVRPAPKVTIDFGDGRRIERTITGNSIHYVLDENGRVVDALPGLNSPQKFLEFLTDASNYSRWVAGAKITMTQDVPDEYLTRNRTTRYTSLTRSINSIGAQVGLKLDTSKPAKRQFEEMPPAMVAAAYAISKSRIEVSMLKGISQDLSRYGDEQVNLDQWKKLAKLSRNEAKLDAGSVAFIRRQTAKNNLSADEFTKLIRNLEDYVSVDTTRNEFLMRLSLLVWLNKGLDKDVEKLNEKVYAELFLTPNEDKWLGLYAPDLYTALDGNGIIK